MPRQAPHQAPSSLRPRSADTVDLEYALKTITPHVGGSESTGQSDRGVRPAAAAGAIRNWWRILNATKFENLTDLFDAESSIWGSSTQPSSCRVQVHLDKPGQLKAVKFERGGYGPFPAYALFPFNSVAAGAPLMHGTEFTLTITIRAHDRVEVDEAVRAFITWGGVGARTRRGCGSIAQRKGHVEAPSMSLGKRWGQLTSAPTLTLWGSPRTDPVAAWAEAVNLYRDFRQKPGFARNHGSEQARRPGRSLYPEADTIRRLTKRHASAHPPTHPVDGFPRADLGLPIIYQFKDERAGDPAATTVQGDRAGATRFASPVITKAVSTPEGFRPTIIILDSPHVWEGNSVRADRTVIPRRQMDLPVGELDRIRPLEGLPIRSALAAFARDQGFVEAPR